MDLITRQTLKGSIYSYLGAILGFVNVALLMPSIFSTAEIGLTNILIASSTIYGQLGTLGFMNVTTKLFPYFRDKNNKHNGFVFLMLSVGTVGFLLCSLFYYLFKAQIIENNIEDSPLFAEYVYLLIPFIFITIFYNLIDVYNRILFNASFGTFVKEFLLRILNFMGILLFYFNVFDFHSFILYYTLVYGVPVLLICLLLIYRGDFSIKPSFKLLTPEFCKKMLSVAFFGLISGLGSMAVWQIDRTIINNYYNLDATGIYSVMFAFGAMILIPGRSLVRISGSVVAESFRYNDYDKINKVYKKSINGLTTVGILAFILIWGNVDNILQFLKPEYVQGKYVVLFVSLAHLFQMMGGTSAEIISFGKFYKEYSVIVLILIISIIGFNLLLLPILNITGAAIALSISFFISSMIKFLFIKAKYNFQPYDWDFLKIILLGMTAYLLSLLMPEIGNFIADIVIRSIILSLLFILPVYYFKLSDDVTMFIDTLIKRVVKHVKK